jgi:hypothetical protein
MNENEQWWNGAFSGIAGQLTKGVRNEMRKRILQTKIKGEKLSLGENTCLMREFFERELKRYQNRRANLAKKLGNPENERLTEEVKFLKARIVKDRGLFVDKMKDLMNENKKLRDVNRKYRQQLDSRLHSSNGF